VFLEIVEQADSLGLDFVMGPEYFGLILAFARITGVLHTAPLISSRNVPVIIRVGLAAVLAYVLSPLVAVDPAAVTWNGPKLGFLILSEVFLGLGMGFVGALAMTIVDVTGTFIGMNSGLSVASQFDPLSNSQQMVLTRLLQVVGFLTFFSYDLHHLVFLGLTDSFIVAPPGAGVLHSGAGLGLSQMLGQIFGDALRLSMPVVIVVLFLNIVAALVTRFAQQMNIYFSVGLPANAIAGLVATGLSIPALILAIHASMGGIRGLMLSVIGGG
jgi:flagellar biosynthetic protein FliR